MKHDNTMVFLEYHVDAKIYEIGNKNTMVLPSDATTVPSHYIFV